MECKDLFGNWMAVEVSCAGTPVNIDDTSITQRINLNCATQFNITGTDCNMAYAGTYDLQGPGNLVWNLDSRTCENCSPNDCTDANGMGLAIPITYLLDLEHITSTFSVTQTMIDEQISPCQPGEAHVTIFSPD